MPELRDDDLVLMRHTDPDHQGWFSCPAAAVPAFEARGWEVYEGEPPAEANPVTAELSAFQAEQVKAAKPAKKAAAKSTAAASSGDEEKE